MEEKIVKTEKGAPAETKKSSFKWQDYLIANFKTAIGLAVALIFAAGYFLILSPKYAEINKRIADMQGSEIEKDSLRSQLNKLENAKKRFEEIDPDDLEKIDDVLPDTPGKDELLSQLEGLILRNGLLLTSLMIEEVKEARRAVLVEGEAPPETAQKPEESLSPDIGRIKISMEVAGTDYENLKKILNVIENNVRLLDVKKISFSPDSNKTSLEIQAYYMKKK